MQFLRPPHFLCNNCYTQVCNKNKKSGSFEYFLQCVAVTLSLESRGVCMSKMKSYAAAFLQGWIHKYITVKGTRKPFIAKGRELEQFDMMNVFSRGVKTYSCNLLQLVENWQHFSRHFFHAALARCIFFGCRINISYRLLSLHVHDIPAWRAQRNEVCQELYLFSFKIKCCTYIQTYPNSVLNI